MIMRNRVLRNALLAGALCAILMVPSFAMGTDVWPVSNVNDDIVPIGLGAHHWSKVYIDQLSESYNVASIFDGKVLDDAIAENFIIPSSVVYENVEYGFRFSMPESWSGYSVVMDNWEGLVMGEIEGQRIAETGPVVIIRHPEWTLENPRQDIPIMVFTVAQWEALQREEFHIGAAPIGPREIWRNDGFVFALPARYNYAFPTGYEEVEDILESNPFK
jgi:hypothetical protein